LKLFHQNISNYDVYVTFRFDYYYQTFFFSVLVNSKRTINYNNETTSKKINVTARKEIVQTNE